MKKINFNKRLGNIDNWIENKIGPLAYIYLLTAFFGIPFGLVGGYLTYKLLMLIGRIINVY